MRTCLALSLALLLGGCNVVTSKTALFIPSDQAGALRLRPGVWVRPDANCVFDPAGPVTTWTSCANAMLVRPNDIADPQDPHQSASYTIAAGDPPIVQIDDITRSPPIFYFQGLRPLKFDAQGQIVEARLWNVQCGPPEPPPAHGATAYRPTKAPLPGLEMDTDGMNCEANDALAVRRAARASLAWPQSDLWPRSADGESIPIRWVRDAN
jgi:hypothetical protein